MSWTFVLYLWMSVVCVCRMDNITVIPTELENRNNSGYIVETTEAQRTQKVTVARTNCKVSTEVRDIGESIYALATSERHVITLDLSFDGDSGMFQKKVPSDLFKSNRWTITLGDTGRALLRLRDNFVPMSLNTMGKGVGTIHVSLKQSPPNCMAKLSDAEAEEYIRERIFENFGSDKSLAIIQNLHVCSRHVVGDKSKAYLDYKCCMMDDTRQMHCEYVEESIWLKILFVSIVLIQVGVVLYFPVLVPESIYTDRKTFTNYIYNTEPGEPLSFTVKTVNDPELINNHFQKTSLHSTAKLERFKESLKNLTPNTVFTLEVDSITISARSSKILAEGTAPAGIYDFIKRFFCQCRMRLEIKSVADCCNENMCKSLPCKITYYWHKCLQSFMIILTLTMITVPWLVRVAFYYKYEDETLKAQREAFEIRNMTLPYTGSVVSFLSPVHVLFVIVYIFLPVVGIIYVTMPDSVKDSLKFTIWRCFSRMKKARKAFACGVFTSCILWPFKRFGVLGFLLFPIWLLFVPFLLLLMSLEVVPMVNLTFRYIVNFWFYMYKVCCPLPGSDNPGKIRTWFRRRIDTIVITQPDETGHRGQRFTLAIALATTLVSMWLVILLAGECLSFYVECVVYLLIGFILDPGRAIRILSVVMLICVYGYQSCTGVYKTYATYCKSVHQQLQDLLEEKLKEVALLPADEQENTLFRIPPDEKKTKKEKMTLVMGSEGQLKWNAARLVLFLDKDDVPYIPKKLLFELANMKHYFCPGKIHMLYLWALYDFSKIMVFLLFVFVVIFAFGQTNNVSSGRQSIAALGSGFLPLMLKKFLFESEPVNKSNLRWYGMFLETLQKFSDRWHPVDIHVSKVHVGLYTSSDEESISETFVDAKDHQESEQNTDKDKEMNNDDNSKLNDSDNVVSDSNETDTLLPPAYEVVSEVKKYVNGGSTIRKMPLEVLGSETMLTGDEGLPNEDKDVDLIVLFSKDSYGEETIDFYLQKKKEKTVKVEEEVVDEVIDMPYTDVEEIV